MKDSLPLQDTPVCSGSGSSSFRKKTDEYLGGGRDEGQLGLLAPSFGSWIAPRDRSHPPTTPGASPAPESLTDITPLSPAHLRRAGDSTCCVGAELGADALVPGLLLGGGAACHRWPAAAIGWVHSHRRFAFARASRLGQPAGSERGFSISRRRTSGPRRAGPGRPTRSRTWEGPRTHGVTASGLVPDPLRPAAPGGRPQNGLGLD